MEVYLDNSATTRCYDEVAELVFKVMCTEYGNPSSMHNKGVGTVSAVRKRNTGRAVEGKREGDPFYIRRYGGGQYCADRYGHGESQKRQAYDHHEDGASGDPADDGLSGTAGI